MLYEAQNMSDLELLLEELHRLVEEVKNRMSSEERMLYEAENMSDLDLLLEAARTSEDHEELD